MKYLDNKSIPLGIQQYIERYFKERRKMFQIYFKDGYVTSKVDYNLFLKTCKSLFEKGFFKRNFTSMEYIKYVVHCDEEEKLNFYFEHTNKEKNIILNRYLKNLFDENTADVFDTDFELNIKESIFCNTITKYSEEYDFEIADFNVDITKYILSSMSANTAIQLKFNIDNNDKFKADLKVVGLEGVEKNSVKAISSTIQQVTAVEQTTSGKLIKLHVKNNHRADSLFALKSTEILTFIFAPYNYHLINTMDIYSSYLDDMTLNNGVSVGFATHPLQLDRAVKIPYETLRRHAFTTGQTGAGKSSILEEQIYDLLKLKTINENVGFTLIDPKKGACIGVMNAIDKLVADKVIESKKDFMKKVRYIDLKSEDCNFGINILDKDVDTTELIDYFKSVFKSTGVRLEKYITHSVNLLLKDDKEHFIGDIIKVLEDFDYRDKLIKKATKKHGNDVTTYFSSLMVEDIKADNIDPIISRISPFVSDDKKKKIFNSKQSLEIEKWIEEGYIILFNFDGFSAQEINMIGGYITTQYYIKGMRREEGAHSHYLLIDEAHDVQVPVLEKIIAKLRSRGVHLWLYTQYLEQFGEELLNSVTSNMSTKIILQQGTKSAKRASEIVKIDTNRLDEMAKMHAYLVTETDKGEIIKTFIKAKPPYRYDVNGKLLEYSSDDLEEDKMFKNNINKRNMELVNDLNKNMIDNYPPLQKESKSNEVTKENDQVFSKDTFI